MISHSMKALSLAMIVAVVACDPSSTGPDTEALSPLTQSSTEGSVLADVRAATAQFHDVNAAIAAGYAQATPCIANEGIRYRNGALLDAVIDPHQPEILIYEPKKNGDVRLVAVQYLVPSALWDATNTSPPSLGDQAFMDRRTPPFGAPVPNYSLVVWAWAPNSSGIYVIQNPAVSCDA